MIQVSWGSLARVVTYTDFSRIDEDGGGDGVYVFVGWEVEVLGVGVGWGVLRCGWGFRILLCRLLSLLVHMFFAVNTWLRVGKGRGQAAV